MPPEIASGGVRFCKKTIVTVLQIRGGAESCLCGAPQKAEQHSVGLGHERPFRPKTSLATIKMMSIS